jgi:membrane-bound serine protease (ClpP class)
MEAKIVNDTVAWARALAGLRGRNQEWAARAVRESVSITASEALAEGVVDLTASTLDDLLVQLEGHKLALPQGTVALRTAGATVRAIEMWWGERVLVIISNPTLAFLLLVLGFYGVLFELYTPSWGVAGTLGVVCLILAFFGLSVLPISYVGLLLIALAFGLFVAEAFVTSYGLLAVGGAVCLVLGGVMLVDSPIGFTRISLGVVLSVAAASFLITVFLLGNVLRAHRHRVSTGGEGLIGVEAVAQDDFARVERGYAGTVLAHGELWKAVCATPVSAKQVVAVQDRDGLTLTVRVAYRPDYPTPGTST